MPLTVARLPHQLSQDIETVQKHVLAIFFPTFQYGSALEAANLELLADKRSCSYKNFITQYQTQKT